MIPLIVNVVESSSGLNRSYQVLSSNREFISLSIAAIVQTPQQWDERESSILFGIAAIFRISTHGYNAATIAELFDIHRDNRINSFS